VVAVVVVALVLVMVGVEECHLVVLVEMFQEALETLGLVLMVVVVVVLAPGQ
jgi:hypothetical protein